VFLAANEREPTAQELADILDEPLKKVKEAKIASQIYSVMPIYEQLGEPSAESTDAKVEHDELIDIIKATLKTFTEREQMVIQLYYFEELSLKEISAILNITESRISQIHKAVLRKIKQRLEQDKIVESN
jgi:RNA polymerase sigma factor for flagellar operon FliA